MSETLAIVENLSKKFCRSLKRSLWYGMQDLGKELIGRPHGGNGTLRKDEFWAVRNVNLELKRGECIGLIGHNGAGKTTLLRMLNGLIKPDNGCIEMYGRVGALIALGAGFNPILTGRENVYVNASILGFKKKEIDQKLDEIVAFSGLEEFIDSPVKHYSSGMYVRLGFSVAANFSPDILLVDEALAVGDLKFIVRCLNRIVELRKGGTGVIFVSHSELQVREAAKRCILLDQGHATSFDSLDHAFFAYNASSKSVPVGHEANAGFIHDGPITMEKVTFGDKINGQLRTGQKMDISIECQVRTPLNHAEFELRFWNSVGQLVTTLRSTSCGMRYDLLCGKNQFHLIIEKIPLAPGHYRIAGGFRRDGEVLGWSRELAHIEVLPPQIPWMGEGLTPMQAHLHGLRPLNTNNRS